MSENVAKSKSRSVATVPLDKSQFTEDRDGLSKVTVFSPVGEQINSQYGVVAYKTWCENEAKRMNRNGRGVRVAFDLKGCCAVVLA